MEDASDYVVVDQLPMLSLSPPFSEESCVIDAQPISYCLPPPSSTSATTTVVGLSCMSDDEDANSPLLSLFTQVSQKHSKPTLSLFPQISKNPSEPTLSLFPQVSENLAASKLIGNNTPTTTPTPSSSAAAPPSTDLCLSLPYTPDTTFSTITTLHRSIGIQHSSAKRSLFQETGEQKFVPAKKIKRQRVIIRPPAVVPAAAAVEGDEEGHWIIKPLTKSDVNGASRLLLPRQDVMNYVLPFMKEEEQYTICNELRGVDVTVYDMDTQTEHILNLRKWATGNFHLVKAWTSEFVKRRNLKEDDVIWIRWEKNNYRFCFRVHTRNQVEAL